MKKVILLAVLALLFISGIYSQPVPTPGVPYTLQPADRNTFLNAHNAVRTAYKLPNLSWDYGLENASAAYAALCYDNPLTHSGGGGVYGENLSTYYCAPLSYCGPFPYQPMTYHVITGWYSEEKNWNCITNYCNTTGGKQCGHITQIVWDTTTVVGCGIAQCTIQSGSTLFYVQNCVCRYKAAGNVGSQNPLGSPSNCPQQPTTLGPITPNPVGPTAPPPTPVSPVPPPPTPIPSPTGSLWWAHCICNYWPTNATTGKQYQSLVGCACEPWVDSSSGTTYCDPSSSCGYYDTCWPVYNIGSSSCPNGMAQSYSRAESSASKYLGLTTPDWVGVGIGIACFIIIIIVVAIIIHKRKVDEMV